MNTHAAWQHQQQNLKTYWHACDTYTGIEWLSAEIFWELFQLNYEAVSRYLDNEIEMIFPFTELRSRIHCPPSYAYSDHSAHTPLECWFGQTEDHLFILTHYDIGDEKRNFNKICHEHTSAAYDTCTSALLRLKEFQSFRDYLASIQK